MEFSKKLRYHMKKQRISQEMLAVAVGVSQGLVSRWARGENQPDVHQGRAIAGKLGLSLDYLLDESTPCMDEAQIDYDRAVRQMLRRVSPQRVWDVLVDIIKQENPAERVAGQGKTSDVGEIDPIGPGSVPAAKRKRLS